MPELITPKNELVEYDKKFADLVNSVVAKANLDRQTAADLYAFIKKEIDTILADYLRTKDIYDSMFNTIQSEENVQYKNVMMCKLGKPPRRPNIVAYLEQLNKTIENSIKSGEGILDLLNIISRANVKKVNVEELNIDNRSVLLDEIIRSKRNIKE